MAHCVEYDSAHKELTKARTTKKLMQLMLSTFLSKTHEVIRGRFSYKLLVSSNDSVRANCDVKNVLKNAPAD